MQRSDPRFGSVGRIADELLSSFAQVDPSAQVALGREHDLDIPLPDPTYFNVLHDARVRALRDLSSTTPEDPIQARLKALMVERLTSDESLDHVGFTRSLLAPLATMVHAIRETFDNIAHETKADWERVATNLAAVPKAMEAYRRTLTESARDGHIVQQRPILFAASQCEQWASPYGDDFYRRLVNSQRDERLDRLASLASEATERFSTFLRHDLLPQARDSLGVGKEQYLVTAQAFLGTEIDLDEIYLFGWAEYERITVEMQSVARELGFRTIDEAASMLDHADSTPISDPRDLIAWLEEELAEVMTHIDRRWFPLNECVRNLRCDITPASMGVMYYTPGSPQQARPGTIWWSLPHNGVIRKWRERSTVFHEGVPGHHLQATLATAAGDLHPWQQLYGQVHGYVEGWAHEAERRMYLEVVADSPAGRLGSLFAQRWRAARVILDLGIHLRKAIPDHNILTNETGSWTFEGAVVALAQASGISTSMATTEVERYLGWPAQALAFSFGAKLWREQIQRLSQSSNTSEPRCIETLLSLGPMGLHNLVDTVTELVQSPRQ